MSKVNLTIKTELNELFAKTEVIQEFINELNNPLELKIFLYKKKEILFDSFIAKIGDSTEIKSKIIKKEKAEEKYADSIAKGNAAIFVEEDPYDDKKIIIHMGNIPPKEKVIFKSYFIHIIEYSEKYEFELFRNLPIFESKGTIYQNTYLKGILNIKASHPILKIDKNILMKNLIISEEKYLDKEQKNYLINYEIKNLPEYNSYNNSDYIPCSKIYFDLDITYPIIYTQESILNSNEKNYCIKYNYKEKKNHKENYIDIETENYPQLFIFLVDQSGSMDGIPIQLASKALKLFLQSLPEGSYFQIIGFGSNYKKYQDEPKEYNKENIIEAIKIIDKLDAEMGGTDIYQPLEYVYNSQKIHDKYNMPRNIFLLTDGEVDDKKKIIEIIEQNSAKYKIYSIGIGTSFDEELIKTSGIIGKGNYNFCKKIEDLNSVIIKELKNIINPFISNLEIKSDLNNKNLIKNITSNSCVKESELIEFNYILNKEEKINGVNLDIKYIDINKKEIKKKYNLIPIELPKGDELSKLIISNYILNNDNNINLTEEEKINLALRYQIMIKNTSLFAEVKISGKISQEMNLQIYEIKKDFDLYPGKITVDMIEKMSRELIEADCCRIEDEEDCFEDICEKNVINNCCCLKEKDDCNYEIKRIRSRDFKCEDKCYKEPPKIKSNNSEDEISNDEINVKEEEKIKKNENNFNLDNKDNVMKLIETQDFVKGFWNENEYTKLIKEKFKKEFDLLKALKDINISDNAAITLLVILFIYKEYNNLVDELFMIIKKAKIYIIKETKDTYENIIQKIGIN